MLGAWGEVRCQPLVQHLNKRFDLDAHCFAAYGDCSYKAWVVYNEIHVGPKDSLRSHATNSTILSYPLCVVWSISCIISLLPRDTLVKRFLRDYSTISTLSFRIDAYVSSFELYNLFRICRPVRWRNRVAFLSFLFFSCFLGKWKGQWVVRGNKCQELKCRYLWRRKESRSIVDAGSFCSAELLESQIRAFVESLLKIFLVILWT